MDTFAAIGSLVISEGATAPLVLTTDQGAVQELRPPPDITPHDRQTADAVFTTHSTSDPYAVPATLLMVSASIATLKSIGIDETKAANEKESDEELPEPGEPRREKDSK